MSAPKKTKKTVETKERDPLAVKVPKTLFDSLAAVRANLPAGSEYSIRAAREAAKAMGHIGTSEWIQRHQYSYDQGIFHGFYVDEEYP